MELTRAGTVFTTHTPVPAGIDRFEKSLIEAQFGSDSGEAGLPLEQILAFGAETYEGGNPDRFNMAVMGMRLAQRVNGVSVLHGQVSREMFTGLWPGFDTGEVPIGSITNGVHGPTWVAPEIMNLAENGYHAGAAEWLADEAQAWEAVAADPARIFQIRQVLRARMVAEARSRLRASWRQRGASEAELAWIASALDENILTIGFARRVPSYKRLTLMLCDQDRLNALLLDPERPLQIVIAGKAHPADDGGKALIQEMVRFTDDPAVRHRIVFLPDYDMELGRTHGAGLRRLAEQPAAAARGVRHVRHEGRAEWRTEPLGAGRLVGRVVRRRQRLGHSVCRLGHRSGKARCGRGGRPVRPARHVGRTVVLRPRA